MRALLRIFRLSRKLFIIIGGVALLMGSSGAFALYIGRDRLLGPSSATVNGMKCTDVNLVTIRKNNHVWLRKYITSDATDGLTRVRTALRVAKAVFDAQKPDLVQVVVLDKNGPTLQSDIRGRALGADVVYVPNPEKVADGVVTQPITARYYDGVASDQGLFYGERIDMTTKDIDGMLATMKDHSDCADPVATEVAKPPEPGKHPKKKPAKEDDAGSGAEKAPEAEAPAAPAAQLSVDANPGQDGKAASAATSDAASARSQTDPETTGASH